MTERLIDLARRALTGDRLSLEALLTECSGVVHVVARSRLGDTNAAEVASVEALARVATGLPGLREPAAFPRWLHQITVRCTNAASAVTRPTGAAAVPVDSLDGGGRPVDLLVATERRERIRLAVEGLPAEQRELVLLHFVEGITYRAMAELLGVGLGTVVRRMRRTLDRLKLELGEDAPGENP